MTSIEEDTVSNPVDVTTYQVHVTIYEVKGEEFELQDYEEIIAEFDNYADAEEFANKVERR